MALFEFGDLGGKLGLIDVRWDDQILTKNGLRLSSITKVKCLRLGLNFQSVGLNFLSLLVDCV